jgi:hypothetical protein
VLWCVRALCGATQKAVPSVAGASRILPTSACSELTVGAPEEPVRTHSPGMAPKDKKEATQEGAEAPALAELKEKAPSKVGGPH